MNPSPEHEERGEPEHLVVRVVGGVGDTNYTLMIARPSGGQVHVREWPDAHPAGAPRESVLAVDEVYARLQRAQAARRRINVNLRQIREWLEE